jgi:hypothetical protein
MSRDPPFPPLTGNPEAHDYLDWYHHLLRTGRITDPLAGGAAQQAPPSKPPESQDEPDAK